MVTMKLKSLDSVLQYMAGKESGSKQSDANL
jgi:hypothetical protein